MIYKKSPSIEGFFFMFCDFNKKVFLSYVKVDKIENAKRIAKYKFFN